MSFQVIADITILPPNEFDYAKPECWQQWIQRFERYLMLSSSDTKDDRFKCNMMCYYMGPKIEEILEKISPQVAKGANVSYADLKQKLNEYFMREQNLVYKRYKFNSRTRRSGETVSDFIADLYSLAEDCHYGDMKDELVRDRIIAGSIIAGTKSRLESVPKSLSLKQAIKLIHKWDAESKQEAK